jgi:hypothetical protein
VEQLLRSIAEAGAVILGVPNLARHAVLGRTSPTSNA